MVQYLINHVTQPRSHEDKEHHSIQDSQSQAIKLKKEVVLAKMKLYNAWCWNFETQLIASQKANIHDNNIVSARIWASYQIG